MYGLYSRAASNQERLMMVRIRYLNFRAVLLLPKTAGSAQTHKSYEFIFELFGVKSKFYKKRGATFFYDITRKLGPLDFTQYRSKSSSF